MLACTESPLSTFAPSPSWRVVAWTLLTSIWLFQLTWGALPGSPEIETADSGSLELEPPSPPQAARDAPRRASGSRTAGTRRSRDTGLTFIGDQLRRGSPYPHRLRGSDNRSGCSHPVDEPLHPLVVGPE